MTGGTVAVKQLSGARSSHRLASLIGEVQLLQSLSHPHVVKYLGSYRTSHGLAIVMEYMEGGELRMQQQQQQRWRHAHADSCRFECACLAVAMAVAMAEGTPDTAMSHSLLQLDTSKQPCKGMQSGCGIRCTALAHAEALCAC